MYSKPLDGRCYFFDYKGPHVDMYIILPDWLQFHCLAHLSLHTLFCDKIVAYLP